jgi:hypothetical protein
VLTDINICRKITDLRGGVERRTWGDRYWPGKSDLNESAKIPKAFGKKSFDPVLNYKLDGVWGGRPVSIMPGKINQWNNESRAHMKKILLRIKFILISADFTRITGAVGLLIPSILFKNDRPQKHDGWTAVCRGPERLYSKGKRGGIRLLLQSW